MSSRTSVVTGPALKRTIAHGGGLWSKSALAREFGVSARDWPRRKGFPAPAWTIRPKTPLWLGWEIWHWLEDSGRLTDAASMFEILTSMRARRNW